jgi:hypothetical protein
LAIAFALGLAGAIAACGGDDNNGNPGGGGGTGGTASMMDAKGGGGSNDAAPDTSQETGPGGAGGADASPDTGTGGGSPDAAEALAVDGAPDTSMDGGAMAPDADAGTTGPDGPVTTPDADDANAVVDDGAANEGAPTGDDADAASPTLFSFTSPEPGNYGWMTDHGALAIIAEGAPQSPGGSLEYTPDFTATNQASVFFQYSPGDGTDPLPVGTTAYAGYTTVHMRLRLRNPAPPQLLSITPFLIGGTRTDEPNNFSDYLDTNTPTPDFFNGGTWIDTFISISNTADGGVPLVPNIADLWKIGVTLALGDDAGAPATPIVIDIDDIFVVR